MLRALADPAVWQEFYEYKLEGGHLSPKDIAELKMFVESGAYLPVVRSILCGGTFSPPKKTEISKMSSAKKRIVYTYSDEENWVLKLLTFLLQRKYDYLFADNLYSFRRNKGVREAVKKLTLTPGIGGMWSYKADISNYFNSVPTEKILPLLCKTLSGERETYLFIESLLKNPLVNDKGSYISEQKGIMAGTPISTFLANLYLSEVDHYFQNNGVVYARYSDDIILFDTTKEALEQDVSRLSSFLTEAGLNINKAKEERASPGETWTFLGICYRDGVIDVAPASVEKLKAKMRRKSRALMRWKARAGADGEKAAKAFIRVFKRKLFENPIEHELTWARWYFPLINTADSLRKIDEYSQSCIRYLATGKHTKSAYNFRYEDMKKLGYISLVNRFYKQDGMGTEFKEL